VIIYGQFVGTIVLTSDEKEYEVKKSNTKNFSRILLYTIVALFVAGGMINCGGSSSGPAQVQAPKAMIHDFIAKHVTMVDKALVNYYLAEEQPMIAATVEKTIEEKKESGELETLQNAAFDFSNLKVEVVGEKEATYRDMPTKAIKVAVTGSYDMKQEGNTKTIPADQTIILQMVGNSWKVTEKANPFKEYHYKGRS
jgi:hypothetical protein